MMERVGQAILAVAILGACFGLGAQQYRGNVNVEAVVLPVTVRTGKGKVVSNISRMNSGSRSTACRCRFEILAERPICLWPWGSSWTRRVR